MTSTTTTTGATTTAGQAKAHASRGVVWLARAGYAARGMIYLLVGGLALLSALGTGGSTTDSKGALESLMGTPGGWIVLVAIGVGLVGYALWRFVQASVDPEDDGRDAKGIVKRVGHAISGLVNLALAWWAIRRGIGYASSGHASQGQSRKESWTAWLLAQPFGPWLVGAVGLVVAGYGVAQVAKAWRAKFEDDLDVGDAFLAKLSPVCRFGLVARGLVFILIGGFFVYAGWTYDAEQAGGIGQAFDAIRGVAFGQVLLGVVALGMLAYGVFSGVLAIYRRIEPRA